MKPERIAKFKADLINQLHQKKPVTFFIVAFALAFCAASVTQDVLYIWLDRPDHWTLVRRPYIAGLSSAIVGFLAIRSRWKWIKDEEANKMNADYCR